MSPINKTLYASIDGTEDIISVLIGTQHEQSVSTATVECIGTSLSIGDRINIDLGFDDDHGHIFKGYVKQIEKSAPEKKIRITAHDDMCLAVDYFFVATNPEEPWRRQNIDAEDLVKQVLQEASLNSFDLESSSFTFAVTEDVYAEVNLISAYDYCHGIADLLAWHIWCDKDGVIHFDNRKPYFMGGGPEASQPGYDEDVPILTLTDADILTSTYTKHERDLRNRVVVVGANDISAIAQASSSWLPAGYYKSVGLYWPILDSQSVADKAADYNLKLLNRLTVGLSLQTIGNYRLLATEAVTVNSNVIDYANEDYYIYYAEHNWGKGGYTTTLELRRKETDD